MSSRLSGRSQRKYVKPKPIPEEVQEAWALISISNGNEFMKPMPIGKHFIDKIHATIEKYPKYFKAN